MLQRERETEMSVLKHRIEKLEGRRGRNSELSRWSVIVHPREGIDPEKWSLFGWEIVELFRAIDGKTRGLPNQSARVKATNPGLS